MTQKAKAYNPPEVCIFQPDAPLERVVNESVKANQAFRDYAYMRVGRSIRVLLARYEQIKKDWKPGMPLPPTTSFETMGGWSRHFAWQKRAEAFDKIMREEDEAAFRKEQEAWRGRRRTLLRVMNSKVGNAMNNITGNSKLIEVVRAMEILAEQSRIEFNDQPGMEVDDGKGNKISIAMRINIPQAPPDLETELSELDDNAEGTLPDRPDNG